MGRGFGMNAAVAHDVIASVAAEAERQGYVSFWTNDTPNGDSLAALAAAAAVTTTIQLGVGVIPLDRRPAEQIVADIERNNLPQHRLLLGVGSGGDQKPLERVRRNVEALHERISATVLVGALGPKMCRLAGSAGDGVVFNWLIPAFAQQAGEWVRDGAREAGKLRPPLLTSHVRCALLPQAEERVVQEAGRYSSNPNYAAHFERMGVSARDTVVQGTDAATLQAGIASYEPVLDETIVRALTPDDSAESFLELLRACAPG